MNSMDKLRGTVLEIDMNPTPLNILECMLCGGQVKFVRADAPKQGVKLAEKKQPDVILCQSVDLKLMRFYSQIRTPSIYRLSFITTVIQRLKKN